MEINRRRKLRAPVKYALSRLQLVGPLGALKNHFSTRESGPLFWAHQTASQARHSAGSAAKNLNKTAGRSEDSRLHWPANSGY